MNGGGPRGFPLFTLPLDGISTRLGQLGLQLRLMCGGIFLRNSSEYSVVDFMVERNLLAFTMAFIAPFLGLLTVVIACPGMS